MISIPFLRKFYLLLALLTCVSLLVFMLNRPGLEGDSLILIRNAYDIPGCFVQAKWTNCLEAGQYPLFQMMPSLIWRYVGASQSFAAHFLAYMSFVGWAWMLWMTYGVLKKKNIAVARLGVLVLLSGYELRYINSSFGEMLGAVFAFGAVASVFNGTSMPWILFFSICAGLTKETAPPFVWLFVIVALWIQSEFTLKKILWVSAGGAVAVAVNSLLNIFRYDSIMNRAYMDPSNFISSLQLQIDQFFGIFISPRAGIFVFWPSLFVCFVLAGLAVVRGPLKHAVPFLGVVGALAVMALGFSRLDHPFGWTAWGGRYMVPWLPVSALILLFAYAEDIRNGYFGWASRHPGAHFALGAVVAFLSLPQYRVLFRHQWVDLIVDYNVPSLFTLLVPGPWVGEWLGAMFLCSVLL